MNHYYDYVENSTQQSLLRMQTSCDVKLLMKYLVITRIKIRVLEFFSSTLKHFQDLFQIWEINLPHLDVVS